MITQELIQQLCQIPITDYLASKGILPVLKRGQEFAYLSPLRDEKTPSFFVHPVKNVWNDFGGDRGNLVRLVRQLEQCDFVTAIQTLQQFTYQPPATSFSFDDPVANKTLNEKESIIAVKLHDNPALVPYSAQRRISYPIARKYLRDVYYQSIDKRLFAVGFENDKGGFALRNQWTDKDKNVREIKRNIGPSWFTTIAGKHQRVVNVFEGFFDFLTALDYYQVSEPNCTTIVLNSTSNLDVALPLLTQFAQVNAYLDNDQAGSTALAKIQASGVSVVDRSTLYQGYKDFNEFWINREVSKI
ncbi:CHC2 zinc finger domain-containing protein [Spirosoma sp. RP8]|uniref:CHC2 zinc finger domain-containing protein n=1 Tax=Spirosoma liriopis TaxID=2937440 RepID=A0ABT0HMW9_9BACT|nr:CHC2 zinc finger domain-containing protein [Spirosoma liriopis]MCK8493517.1 CHC2 zinc finger domain-containing protein [Spirosoma liriopis]